MVLAGCTCDWLRAVSAILNHQPHQAGIAHAKLSGIHRALAVACAISAQGVVFRVRREGFLIAADDVPVAVARATGLRRPADWRSPSVGNLPATVLNPPRPCRRHTDAAIDQCRRRGLAFGDFQRHQFWHDPPTRRGRQKRPHWRNSAATPVAPQPRCCPAQTRGCARDNRVSPEGVRFQTCALGHLRPGIRPRNNEAGPSAASDAEASHHWRVQRGREPLRRVVQNRFPFTLGLGGIHHNHRRRFAVCKIGTAA